MKDLLFIKLGGSLITDKTKPFTARFEVIKKLAREIAALRKNHDISLVLGNGAGSFGHAAAEKYQTHKGLKSKECLFGLAKVADAAIELNRIVVKELLSAGVPAISVSPASTVLAKKGEIVSFYTDALTGYLNLGMVPVIYGDVAFDQTQGCAIISTEKQFVFIAEALKNKGCQIKGIIHCGSVKGVCGRGNKLIAKITPGNIDRLRPLLFGSNGFDVTGGMLHKVEESLALTKNGVSSYIVNGNNHKVLDKILSSSEFEGTVIMS